MPNISHVTIYWDDRQITEIIDISLKERTFDNSFNSVTIYVNEINLRNKSLVDVFIEDNRQPEKVNTVIAPKGIIFSDPANATVHLKLFNGSIHQTNLNDKTAHAIQFDTYEISLDTKRSTARRKKKPRLESSICLRRENRSEISVVTFMKIKKIEQ